jgi:hypothetical protein
VICLDRCCFTEGFAADAVDGVVISAACLKASRGCNRAGLLRWSGGKDRAMRAPLRRNGLALLLRLPEDGAASAAAGTLDFSFISASDIEAT